MTTTSYWDSTTRCHTDVGATIPTPPAEFAGEFTGDFGAEMDSAAVGKADFSADGDSLFAAPISPLEFTTADLVELKNVLVQKALAGSLGAVQLLLRLIRTPHYQHAENLESYARLLDCFVRPEVRPHFHTTARAASDPASDVVASVAKTAAARAEATPSVSDKCRLPNALGNTFRDVSGWSSSEKVGSIGRPFLAQPASEWGMELSEAEKRLAHHLIEAGEPLPPSLLWKLATPPTARKSGAPVMLWPEKPTVFNGAQSSSSAAVAPAWACRVREVVCQSEADPAADPAAAAANEANDSAEGVQWRNLLVRGDNWRGMQALLHDRVMAEQIQRVGGIKLIYIDPPFNVGVDFNMATRAGVRMTAYRDYWGRTPGAFLTFLFRRLILMRDLLADDGAIFVHCDWRLSGAMRLMLDEIFGAENFVNEIIFRKDAGQRVTRYFPRKHDTIFAYARTSPDRLIFDPTHPAVRVPYSETAVKMHFRHDDGDGRKYRQYPNGKRFYVDDGKLADDVWADISGQEATSPLMPEYTGFPNQKPQRLLERIIAAASRPGDLVADFFCGAGTTVVVAQRLGRRWIGMDCGPSAIHTTRLRLLRQGTPSFAIADLTTATARVSPANHNGDDGAETETESESETKVEIGVEGEGSEWGEWRARVLQAYRADPLSGRRQAVLHGQRPHTTAVYVTAGDRAATVPEIQRALRAAKRGGYNELDVLAVEFDPTVAAHWQRTRLPRDVTLRLRRIVTEAVELRSGEPDSVVFPDLMAPAIAVAVVATELTVTLVDFCVVCPSPTQAAEMARDRNGHDAVAASAEWHAPIDAWSVCIRPSAPVELDPRFAPLSWHQFRSRPDAEIPLTTGPMSLAPMLSGPLMGPLSGPLVVEVCVMDWFGHETRTMSAVSIGQQGDQAKLPSGTKCARETQNDRP